MSRNELEPAVEEKIQYIVVRIGDEQYGINIAYIDNIVRMQSITRVPKTLPCYIGVINLRGEVVPVMSVRRKMHLSEDVFEKSTRIIILKLEELGLVGVVVDAVSEVVSLGDSQIEKNVQSANKNDLDFISGVGKNGDQLISILDINKITAEDNVQ
ncbi:MAG TPA: chemotaxis protein CheW [Lachnospiraceae bacterium]|jgi:purine-binding chemotaxis protein CheW|nr:chemotaxis protein CheW [Lachnospiraceae bacterium]HAN51153.1 chemotaxis protein CheW [Lachnospiraceae bacterium]